MLIDEDPLGQVKFVGLFKVTVLNLHKIMRKPEIKLIIQQLDTLELMCFKLSQLSYYVCYCYGILLHENSEISQTKGIS